MQTSGSPSARRDRTRAGVVAFVIAVLLATSCGASAEVDVSDNAAGSAAAQTQDTTDTDTAGDTEDTEAQAVEPTPVPETEPAEPADAGDQPASSPRIGEGTFELVLENGETYTAPVLCVLEPQIAAGSEILFTANGQSDGRFVDVTQWGETAFGGTQDVEVIDSATFDSLWRATGSTGLELELSGSVITGSGGFYVGEEFSGPYTQGDLTVSC